MVFARQVLRLAETAIEPVKAFRVEIDTVLVVTQL
jgi:hypothetical protein